MYFIGKAAKELVCCLSKVQQVLRDSALKKCFLVGKVAALEDQMLACLRGSDYPVCKLGVKSAEVKLLPGQ